MLFFNNLLLGLLVNTISIPFDNGANIKGSQKAPDKIIEKLDFLNIDNKYFIDVNQHLVTLFGDGFLTAWDTLNSNKFPLTIGGDHTVAISSVQASNEFTKMNSDILGVLWCDAHADFNTMQSSISKNLHGMPVAVLCGHTLPILANGPPLDPMQFAYFGVRDIDSLEFYRFQEHNMKIVDSDLELDEWLKMFDKIHVSFDIDCLDPSVIKSVNTPVNGGKSVEQIKNIFEKVKKSGKLISMDLVEFNPDKGGDIDIVLDIVKTLF
jgi:arginase